MRIVQDDAEAKRVARAVMGWDFAEPSCGLLVMDGDVVHGVVVLNNYEPGRTIDLTFAGKFDARALRQLAGYVFDQLKVRRVTAVTRMSNDRAKRALQRFGFEREGTMRHRFEDEDGALFGLIRNNFPLRF